MAQLNHAEPWHSPSGRVFVWAENPAEAREFGHRLLKNESLHITAKYIGALRTRIGQATVKRYALSIRDRGEQT